MDSPAVKCSMVYSQCFRLYMYGNCISKYYKCLRKHANLKKHDKKPKALK